MSGRERTKATTKKPTSDGVQIARANDPQGSPFPRQVENRRFIPSYRAVFSHAGRWLIGERVSGSWRRCGSASLMPQSPREFKPKTTRRMETAGTQPPPCPFPGRHNVALSPFFSSDQTSAMAARYSASSHAGRLRLRKKLGMSGTASLPKKAAGGMSGRRLRVTA